MEVQTLQKLTKRRINEFEIKLKKMQRELDKLKSFKKGLGRMRKQQLRAIRREADLMDIIEEIADEQQTYSQQPEQPETLICKQPRCNSKNTTTIEAGIKRIVVCNDCGSRYTINSLAKAS